MSLADFTCRLMGMERRIQVLIRGDASRPARGRGPAFTGGLRRVPPPNPVASSTSPAKDSETSIGRVRGIPRESARGTRCHRRGTSHRASHTPAWDASPAAPDPGHLSRTGGTSARHGCDFARRRRDRRLMTAGHRRLDRGGGNAGLPTVRQTQRRSSSRPYSPRSGHEAGVTRYDPEFGSCLANGISPELSFGHMECPHDGC